MYRGQPKVPGDSPVDRSLALYIQDRDAGTQLDQGLGLDNNDPVVKFGPLEIKKGFGIRKKGNLSFISVL